MNQSYADLPADMQPAGTTGHYDSEFPASGAVAPADMLYLDTLLVAAPSAPHYDHDDSMSEEEI